jgi:hypothetical protein
MNMLAAMDRIAILDLAVAWRGAIERTPRGSMPTLAQFPRGACGDASLLLGEYLARNGVGSGTYVCGTFRSGPNSGATHAWLDVRGFIVDITSDQFTHGPQMAVFVSASSAWHQAMRQQRNHAALSSYDSNAAGELLAWFEAICRHL